MCRAELSAVVAQIMTMRVREAGKSGKEELKLASLFPLLSCDSWRFSEKNPDRKNLMIKWAKKKKDKNIINLVSFLRNMTFSILTFQLQKELDGFAWNEGLIWITDNSSFCPLLPFCSWKMITYGTHLKLSLGFLLAEWIFKPLRSHLIRLTPLIGCHFVIKLFQITSNHFHLWKTDIIPSISWFFAVWHLSLYQLKFCNVAFSQIRLD